MEIGNRPAGELAPDARMLKVIRAVDAVIGNTAQVQRASTDANIPLSLGREAIAIGGGGTGGGAHTLQEWFDCAGRDLGLSRILLTLLALSGVRRIKPRIMRRIFALDFAVLACHRRNQ